MPRAMIAPQRPVALLENMDRHDLIPSHSSQPTAGQVSDARLRLLREVLHERVTGRTVEELAGSLKVSRNAVQQHVTALERDGLLRVLGQRSTGGRPSRTYSLTEAGLELFPRRYALLADSLLRHTEELFGEVGMNRLLTKMADELATEMAPRLADKSGEARLHEAVKILNELGYDAYLDANGHVAAVNCVFHKVARSRGAVCRFDLMILAHLLGGEVEHSSCIAEGDGACVFSPRPPAQPQASEQRS